VLSFDLGGSVNAENALTRFREQIAPSLETASAKPPLLEIKLTGKVGFHPFELSRDLLLSSLDSLSLPLHIEVKNQLSLSTGDSSEEKRSRSLEDIERAVLEELIASNSTYQDRQTELASLALSLRRLVLSGEEDDDELLGLFKD